MARAPDISVCLKVTSKAAAVGIILHKSLRTKLCIEFSARSRPIVPQEKRAFSTGSSAFRPLTLQSCCTSALLTTGYAPSSALSSGVATLPTYILSSMLRSFHQSDHRFRTDLGSATATPLHGDLDPASTGRGKKIKNRSCWRIGTCPWEQRYRGPHASAES